MYGYWIIRLQMVLALLVVGLSVTACADDSAPSGQQQNIETQKLKPKWRGGDQWAIETSSLQRQASNTQQAQLRSQPIRWRFTVTAIEKIQKQPCYRVQIRCLAVGRRQPATTLWVDQTTLALRQLQTQMPIPGGFRTVTESYQFAQGKASPVLSPLTALPVDLPLFATGDQTKSLGTFHYEAFAGPAGTKAIGEVRFATEVKQMFSLPKAENIKGLLSDTFSKELQQRPVVEVQLKSSNRKVRQLWQRRPSH